jgi:endonuclease/exonuclease/phosphatase family metal-dependent hydrolase
MKNNFLLFLVGITLMALFSLGFQNFGEAKKQKSDIPSKQELRVMSYNIHHANPPSKEDIIDLKAIIETIKAEDPDLVALQEIDADTQRSGKGNQAQQIGDALSMHVFFGKAINFEKGEYGVAILSKFPILDSEIIRLPTVVETNGEPRVLATIDIELPDGGKIRFGSTHLDAQKADTNRLLQIQKIVEITKKVKIPFIVAGDFNAAPGSEVIDILDKNLKRTCENCAPTIPAEAPEKAIDFIAFRSDSRISVMEHQVIEQDYASDHLPVLAVLGI